jgi:hypothetical protein
LLTITQALPARLKCPQCGTSFQVPASGVPVQAGSNFTAGPLPGILVRESAQARPAASAALPRPLSVAAASEQLGSDRHLAVLVGAVVGTGLLIAVLAAVLAVCWFTAAETPLASEPAGVLEEVVQNDGPPPLPAGELLLEPVAFAKKPPAENARPGATKLPPQAIKGGVADNKPAFESDESAVPAALQARINKAIDRGVAYLKQALTGKIKGDQLSQTTGGTALAALALLSSGVSADDPAVVAAVERIRTTAPQLRSAYITYELACCIWLLDRLGAAQDEELIRKLALRLVAGQQPRGGWDYPCPLLTPAQEDQLLTLLQTTSPDRRTGSKEIPEAQKEDNPRQRSKNQRGPMGGVPADLKDLPVFQFQPGQPFPPKGGTRDDNSNTQFAILALWTAKAYGVPTDRSLAMAEARFRGTQAGDGTWAYMIGSSQWKASMTCAGLLGLAVGHGVRPADAKKGADPQDRGLPADPAIKSGLLALGKRLGGPAGRGRGMVGADAHGDLYFLWSVERVAVVYDLPTIGGKNWYRWGAEILVDHQQQDGRWINAFPGTVDTSFALLFLKRANVVQSLTKRLQSLGSARDPGAEGGRRMGGGALAEVKSGGGRQAGVIKQRAVLAPRPPAVANRPNKG